MKKFILSLLICVSLYTTYTPKAESAFYVKNPAGATFLVLGGLAGGTASYIFGVGFGSYDGDFILQALGYLGVAAGAGLIVLNEDHQKFDILEDVPAHISSELNYLIEQKVVESHSGELEVQKIIFTAEEIDPILELAEGEMSEASLKSLRRSLLLP